MSDSGRHLQGDILTLCAYACAHTRIYTLQWMRFMARLLWQVRCYQSLRVTWILKLKNLSQRYTV